MRARRREDPANYVLVEELCVTSVDTPGKTRRTSTKTERRVLGDEEQVYPVQRQWNLPGKFVLMERDKVPEVRIEIIRRFFRCHSRVAYLSSKVC